MNPNPAHAAAPLAALHRLRAPLLLALLFLLACVALIAALKLGSVAVSWRALGEALRTALTGAAGGAGIESLIVMELRLPRAAAAFAVGGLLAVAGALMQALLRNPLADPYVLGISGGAAAAALTTLLLGLSGAWLTGGAGVGALLSMWLVFGVARGHPTRLLLTGVVVASGWGAVIGFLLAVGPDGALRGMVFWLMGDLSAAAAPAPALLALGVGLAASMALARPLNLLARGDLEAAALGVPVAPLRAAVYLSGSLLTAVAVAVAGAIGFVGLVVPHLLRLLGARDHRLLLPACALAGGALLTVADTLARTLIAPRQLPAGVLTALLGVPLFLWLLNRDATRARTPY